MVIVRAFRFWRSPKISLEMAKGFTFYMVKAVIGGRAGEALDLAVINLWC